jgi:hypothetical protein
MSGLLRRIKRSRAADAGETPTEEQAAGAGGAPTTGEPSEASGPTVAREPDTPAALEPGAVPRPAIARDPDMPAGLEPGAASARTRTGRPGRLRRRLRYLRRARELMLRDLGGLVYEVNRSGGGDYGAHGNLIASKVERLKSLDAETRALETALAAPRAETVVFQPGVGGTCDFCGELYGSTARFCSNCGSPTGSAVRATPAPLPLPKPLGARADEKPVDETPAEKAPAAKAPTDEPPTELKAADKSHEAATEVKPGDKAADETPAADQVKPAGAAPPDEATLADEANPADEKPGSGGRNPVSGISNGRNDEDGAPPELSPGDPLATRESRS